MLDVTLNRAQVSKRARLAVALLAVAVAVPVAGLVVFAQAAGFGGTVFDPANRATPNVTIVLTHAGTGAVREVKTDAQGRFEFAALPPGEYAFEASRPAFMTVKGTVTVTSRGLQRDLNLRLGELRETVVVVGRPTGAPAAPAAATPRSVAARPPCEPGEVDAGGHIVPPRKLHDVKPVYPGYLISEGVSGPVTLEGVVGRDGTVHNLKVVSAPHPELARAALDAVGGWLFDATLLNCEPVDVKIGVTVNFVLQ
jgi:TonB family protein